VQALLTIYQTLLPCGRFQVVVVNVSIYHFKIYLFIKNALQMLQLKQKIPMVYLWSVIQVMMTCLSTWLEESLLSLGESQKWVK
jgi:hypothetical protein